MTPAARKFFIIVVAAVALAALAGGVWLLRRTAPAGVSPQPSRQSSPSPVAGDGLPFVDPAACDVAPEGKERDECRKVGFYAWGNQREEAARQSGNPADCDRLWQPEVRDRCRLAYVTQGKLTTCAPLETDQYRQNCQVKVNIQGDDFSACASITDENERQYCEEQTVRRNRDQGPSFCDRFGERRQACLERYWTIEAAGLTDYKLCRKIAEPAGVERCLAILPPDRDGDALSDYQESAIYDTDPRKPDTDGDGLDDYDEVKTYQTNPQRPDTDGDGYPDGEEVKAGFNPKGAGKLKP